MSRYLRICNVVLIGVMLVMSVFAVANLTTIGEDSSLTNLTGDILWNISLASDFLKANDYPQISESVKGPFAYPVPMLVLLQLFSAIPRDILSLVFVVFYPVAATVCLFLSIRLFDDDKNPYRWLIAFLTFIIVWDYIQFDIRSFNINMILFILILLAMYFLKRDWACAAGVFLAFSVAIKLYSVLLIPLWLYRKKYRACFYTVIALLILFIVFPVCTLGWSKTVHLTLSWIGSVKSTSTAQASQIMSCYLISFNRALTSAMGADHAAGIGSLSQTDWNYANHLLLFFRVVWAMAIVSAVVFINRFSRSYKFQRMFSLLILAPIPLSPLLQPHHMVLLIPAVYYLVHMIIEKAAATKVRLAAACMLLLIFIIQMLDIPEELRGFSVAAICVLLSCGLTFLNINTENPETILELE